VQRFEAGVHHCRRENKLRAVANCRENTGGNEAQTVIACGTLSVLAQRGDRKQACEKAVVEARNQKPIVM